MYINPKRNLHIVKSRTEETKAHARRAVARHQGDNSLVELEQRVDELRSYKREEHEESFIWEPREFKIFGLRFTLGSRRVPSIGTVARRLLR
jgi:hypothetical protein